MCTDNECFDCFRPAEKECRKCGVSLCDKCYNIMHGFCSDCREIELNGADDE